MATSPVWCLIRKVLAQPRVLDPKDFQYESVKVDTNHTSRIRLGMAQRFADERQVVLNI